jgi:hypothetical protein
MSILTKHKSNIVYYNRFEFHFSQNKYCNFICGLYVVVTCNQPTSNVTKISWLIYTCNQSDINTTKINHLFNMCTNVTKVSHFDYTHIINIHQPHLKKRKTYIANFIGHNLAIIIVWNLFFISLYGIDMDVIHLLVMFTSMSYALFRHKCHMLIRIV